MAKIYVASKTVDFLGIISTEKQHLYLVYDPDNDPTNGNEEIIRGGPEDNVTFDQILIEAGSDINTSEDDFEPGETPADRNYTELDVGTTDPGLIANIWDEMVDHAEALGALEGDGKYHADTDYSPIGANSNSVATSVLHHVGIEIADQPPQVGGTGNAIDLSTFPGVNNYLATDGNDTLTFELGYPKIVYDQGGNDIYTVDMNDVAPGSGILTIRETAEASSTDTLKLEHIDAGDVGVFKTLNGNDLVITANGQVVGWVLG